MTNRPPELTPASRTFVRLLDATEHWSRRRAGVASLLTCLAVLVFECLTPITVSTMPPHMLATAFVVWMLGERGGLSLGLALVLAGTIIKHVQMQASGLPPLGPASETWNTLAHFFAATLLALVVNGMRSALLLERWRASSDGLTGALNKMAFSERMGATVARARADRRSLVLAYMDLDSFKAVNDHHGHAAGDRVLRAFASAAAQAIRATDLFARIGGDEFVALLAVRSCEEGDAVAAMLHERLTAILNDTGYEVTCSMGALVADACAIEAGGGVLELADKLMYEVKRSGKNALRIARGGRLTSVLHAAYAPPAGSFGSNLIGRIDGADRVRAAPPVERRTAA